MQAVFTRQRLNDILTSCVGKTLGEVDVKNVFDLAIQNSKVTGIAGMVIEQSVLDYPQNPDQKPDLIVDGVETELKTTGTREKQVGSRGNKKTVIKPKEPLTITAVSPLNIINEEWDTSALWHKLEHLLFVFYLYSSKKAVPAIAYKDFRINGYKFYELDEAKIAQIKSDWLLVRNKARDMNSRMVNPSNSDFGPLSKVHYDTIAMDLSSPQSLRFRIRKRYFETIIDEIFNGKLEVLPEDYSSFSQFDAKLISLTQLYKDKTVEKLSSEFNIKNYSAKSIGESIVCGMFKAEAKKMNKIEFFQQAGLIAKTIVYSNKGKRTEDMKLFRIDFEELADTSIDFEDSSFKSYFADSNLLCVLFKEPSTNAPLKDNKFLGFKRFNWSESFINDNVKKLFNTLRDMVINNKIVDVVQVDKDGNPIINKNGKIRSAPNFPKSKDDVLFVRGGGQDSSDKAEKVNDVEMLRQYVWIKGSFIIDELDKK